MRRNKCYSISIEPLTSNGFDPCIKHGRSSTHTNTHNIIEVFSFKPAVLSQLKNKFLTEVNQLDSSFCGEQDVVALDVSMDGLIDV